MAVGPGVHKVYGLAKKAKFARDFGLKVQGSKVQGCFSFVNLH